MRLVSVDDLTGIALDYAVSRELDHKPVHNGQAQGRRSGP